jgi:hypothetical protein
MKSFYEVKKPQVFWFDYVSKKYNYLFFDIAKILRILYGFYLGHNQNFTDIIWIVGPLGQAIRTSVLYIGRTKTDVSIYHRCSSSISFS